MAGRISTQQLAEFVESAIVDNCDMPQLEVFSVEDGGMGQGWFIEGRFTDTDQGFEIEVRINR